MTVALYPGSFDPVHNGHVDVVATALQLFDGVVVAVGHSPTKPSGLFTPDERVALLADALGHLGNVRVSAFTGLVTAAAKELGADCLVKGVRGPVDLEEEMTQAQMNRITGQVPTVLVPATEGSAFVSSTYVRQIAQMGGDVSQVVPANVAIELTRRLQA